MAVQLKLTQKQIQKLALTPQMRLAIHLLQLPLLELRTVLEKEMVENPVLEELGKTEPEQERPETPEDQPPSIASEIPPAARDKEEFDRQVATREDWKEFSGQGGVPLMDSDEAQRRHDFVINQQAQIETLAEHLGWQLSLTELTDEEIEVGREIIGNVNENGYLDATLEDIARAAGVDASLAEKILKVIQRFDPVGIASRSLRECLLVQLAHYRQEDTVAYKIVDAHLDKLEKKQFPQIAKALDVSLEKVREARDVIAHLDPKPGLLYTSERLAYVVPDIRLQPTETGYNIIVNERELPQLRISSLYKNLLAKNDVDENTKEYIRQKIKSGVWLIRSIQQRQVTLLRITEEIMKTQQEFLVKGPDSLKPLTLKEVAQATGLHESTVSRVVANKYIETPSGVFSLKQFFSSKVRTSDGEFCSQRSIQSKISELLKNENPQVPLSDAAITEHLRSLGVNIARRTVAKYRQEMKILPANLRKAG